MSSKIASRMFCLRFFLSSWQSPVGPSDAIKVMQQVSTHAVILFENISLFIEKLKSLCQSPGSHSHVMETTEFFLLTFNLKPN